MRASVGGRSVRACSVAVCWLLLAGVGVVRAQDPWADEVISYDPGVGAEEGYTNSQAALGEPERYTGEGSWPGAVTPFNPAWLPEEVVSIGGGGHLTVRFDEPIRDDPAHRYGVDFILFGNGSFGDADWPNGQVSGLWEEGPFSVSVSADGVNFVALPGEHHDAMFPAVGYLDLLDPYAVDPGIVPSNFTKPVDPALAYDDFHGADLSEILAIYDGSGGGLPLDIGVTGLSEVCYVRVDVSAGATSPEFDAFVAVPEPASGLLLGVCLCAGTLRLRRRLAQRACEQKTARPASCAAKRGA